MQSLIAILIVLFVAYILCINYKPKKRNPSRKLSQNFGRSVNIGYSDGTPFETYCPYRALLGIWTNEHGSVKISLLNPQVLKVENDIIENPGCKISGRTLEIFGSGKKYILRDGKCLMTGKSGKPEIFSLV